MSGNGINRDPETRRFLRARLYGTETDGFSLVTEGELRPEDFDVDELLSDILELDQDSQLVPMAPKEQRGLEVVSYDADLQPITEPDSTADGMEAVSLDLFLTQAVRHEDLPAPVAPWLRWGALSAMGTVAAFLVALWIVHSNVDNPAITPRFFDFGWGLLTGASFIEGAGLLVIFGLVTLGGGAWLAVVTQGFQTAPTWGLRAALGLTAVGALASIPLLLILTVVALNFAWQVLKVMVVLWVVGLVIRSWLEG